MHPARHAARMSEKYPFLGPFFWVSILQYLLVQLLVAAAWVNPAYNWSSNAISDLGATACGLHSGRQVCSPLHPLMNISFVVLGLTMLLGSALLYHQFDKKWGSRLGFTMMGIAGVGTLMVGLFPENVVPPLHGVGAALAFFLGDAAMIVLGLSLRMHLVTRVYSVASGIIALSALALYTSGNFLGLGLGGMERLAGYPQTFWLIIFGAYISARLYRRRSLRAGRES